MAKRIWVSQLPIDSSSSSPMVETKPGEPMLSQLPEYVFDPSRTPWARIDRGEHLDPDEIGSAFYVYDPHFDTTRDKG